MPPRSSRLLLLGIATVVVTTIPSVHAVPSSITFDDWLELHGDTVEEHELEYRRRVFTKNAKGVDRHNAAFAAGHTTYSMTMESPFAAMTDSEFERDYLMEPQDCSATTHRSSGKLQDRFPLETDDAVGLHQAESCDLHVDWRTKGIVTPVKNQGACGSCWTFSTSGCLEAHVCLAKQRSSSSVTSTATTTKHHGHLDCTEWTGLAEQQLVDCAGDFNNNGCAGGLPSQAFEYLKYSGGMDSEDSYPYHAKASADGCLAKKGKVAGIVGEVFNVTSGDEDDLVRAVALVGPVSIAYQVAADFRFYEHGVYDSFNATTNSTVCQDGPSDVNHAVVAVGLGSTSDDVPYYIVRNSWGTSWGMEGYFWMKRGENLCGVSDCSSFPIVPITTGDNRDKGENEEEDNFDDKLVKKPSLRVATG